MYKNIFKSASAFINTDFSLPHF